MYNDDESANFIVESVAVPPRAVLRLMPGTRPESATQDILIGVCLSGVAYESRMAEYIERSNDSYR